MARDIQDTVRSVLTSDSAKALAGTAFNEALKGVGSRSNGGSPDRNARGPLSGMRGVAAGAGAAALAPVAAKGIGKLIRDNGVQALAGGPKKLVEDAGSKLGDSVGDKVTGKVDEAGGPSGILKDTVKSALPFGGGGSGGGGKGKNDAEGVGKGRRMPVQQTVDIGLPIETVYNQWTQFEEWPKFMHRVTRASQEDPCKVNFAVKIWGRTREFTAEIETQRPNDRIKWKTTQGMNLTGLVAFRELGPNLTRILLSFDVAPGGLVEKYARGARYVKRAARGDLHRFVAYIEMLEHETGAWRGVIEDGELVEDHDPSYDEQREYGSADELVRGRGSEEDDESDEDDDDEADDEKRGERRGRSQRSSRKSSSGSSRRGQQTRGRSGSAGRQQRGSSAARGGATASRSRSSGSGSRSSGSGSRSSGSGSRSSGSSSGRRGGATSARGRSGSSKGSSTRGSSKAGTRSRGSSGSRRG